MNPTTSPDDAPAEPGTSQPAAPGIWSRADRLLAAVATGLLIVSTATALTRAGTDPPAATGSSVEAPASVSDLAQDRARDAADCEVLVDGQPFPDRSHLDRDEDVPPEVLYPTDRPAHSGRHFPRLLDLPSAIPPDPIDERVVVHNMEHGSVVVWFDPAQVDEPARREMEGWMQERRALGFASPAAGGIFVSPTGAIASGKAIAIRAWGVALDCVRFDVTVADAFLQRHWGSRGDSPEANLSPFPPGIMREEGRSV